MLEKPTLIGASVVLRPITVNDSAAMFASLFDQENMRLTGTQASFSLEEVQQHCQRIEKAEDRVDLAITLKENPEYIGEAVLNQIDWKNRSANFRIALAGQSFYGKGYGTEAARLLVEYGIQVLKLHRIELEVYDFNPRAQHVYEKIGFVTEGIKRDVLLWEGEYHHAIVMSILEPGNSREIDRR